LSWLEFSAVVAADLRFRRGVQDAENLNERSIPAKTSGALAITRRARVASRNDSFRGDVAGAEVFGKKRSQHVVVRE